MSIQIRRRRDTADNNAVFLGGQGEIVVDTTNNRMIVHDGVTVGGWAAAKLCEVMTLAAFTPQIVATSQTIDAPGFYVVTQAGITLTLAAFAGVLTIKDQTRSSAPNIKIAAMVDGLAGGATIASPKASLSLVWSSQLGTWLLF
ncbi:MAG TPA: hypothetical protein VMI72_17925 [Roseiarcus sp.]|nr:hypothetical protein [Roseiarcus sp.]